MFAKKLHKTFEKVHVQCTNRDRPNERIRAHFAFFLSIQGSGFKFLQKSFTKRLKRLKGASKWANRNWFYIFIRICALKGCFCAAFIDNFCGALARKLTMKPDLYRKSDETSSEATRSDESPQTLQQDNKSCHHSKEKRNEETHKTFLFLVVPMGCTDLTQAVDKK